jgi:hypothetical protein
MYIYTCVCEQSAREFHKGLSAYCVMGLMSVHAFFSGQLGLGDTISRGMSANSMGVSFQCAAINEIAMGCF